MKSLKVVHPEKCVGCMICVLIASIHINKKLSLAGSPISVVRSNKQKEVYAIEIDEAHKESVTTVANQCPEEVFSVEEDTDETN